MSRRDSFLFVFVCVVLNALVPAAASAQDELSSCKSSYGDASRTEKLEDNSKFYGTAEYPARIICDDMQFFADYAETFKTKDLVTAQGHVVYVSAGNRIAADRMANATLVPSEAIFQKDGRPVVYRLRGSKFDEQPVEIVRRGREQAAVSAGVNAGDKLAVRRPVPDLIRRKG